MNFINSSLLVSGLISSSWAGTIITFSDTDFTLTPTYNRLRDFSFNLELIDELAPGQVYTNPSISSLEYSIFGILDTDSTPSGFPAFDLQRGPLDNTEFYGQGSLLSIEIASDADLSDGLQLSELVEFTLDAREDGTGRYHPAHLTFSSDGSGVLQNSDNEGGINPGNGLEVDVNLGDEYRVELFTNPSLTIGQVVPEPSSILLTASGLFLCLFQRRRK